ncbi:histidine ammonia-lyase [Nitrococcus mobilis Nb-231]|uniref:Histidine ammonia-lyase n=1 Tax=Nitrococcus mobilis Nb-231 TaxID=314278 RepID=A4BTN4_9GAMM|nr:histidine ammonia-lyase [Nitrococcus mobilis Nb-231]
MDRLSWQQALIRLERMHASIEQLDRPTIVAIARREAYIALPLPPRIARRIDQARQRVEALAAGEEPVYGVTTGLGALATTAIAPAHRRTLQHALLRSHAAGVGPAIEPKTVRAMMAIRAKTLAMGYSGVRRELVEALVRMLNADVLPAVPEYGSLGASGDLAPLAHIALCLCGEGWALVDGERVAATTALTDRGLTPVELEVKEGLSLINGTDGMLSMLILGLDRFGELLDTADLTAAMSIEAGFGTDRAFQAELQRLRPHPGQEIAAARLRRLLQGSSILAHHRHSTHLVQDAYSFRCTPQVHGAARDTADFATQVAERELRSVTDNPVVLADGRLESSGNFHGEPLAFALDFLAIAAAELGAIAERRIDRLLDPQRSQGLPAFLTPDPGINSGLMIAHYTAASLAEENRRLANPASVGSLPTSAMQEDHNSMGWSAGRKLYRILDNITALLAIEALCAAQALDLRAPLAPAPATASARERLRREVPFRTSDAFAAQDIDEAVQLVRSGALVEAAQPYLR